MNYKTIEEILIILKTNPREFHEENYDKETIDRNANRHFSLRTEIALPSIR